MATDQETRDRAEEMYVIDGMTQDEISEQTGISIFTIKRWSADDGWKAKRREYRDAENEIKRYSRLTRLKLIKDAMTSLDPQKIYAFAALERASLQGPGHADPGVPVDIPDREIKTPQEAISVLQEAIESKLRLMLASPDAINLSAIKDIKKALELVEGMKGKYAPEEEETRIEGHDEEQARFWREKVLKGR